MDSNDFDRIVAQKDAEIAECHKVAAEFYAEATALRQRAERVEEQLAHYRRQLDKCNERVDLNINAASVAEERAERAEAEVKELRVYSANYHGRCGLCNAANCDMLTDSACVACERDALRTQLAAANERVKELEGLLSRAIEALEVVK